LKNDTTSACTRLGARVLTRATGASSFRDRTRQRPASRKSTKRAYLPSVSERSTPNDYVHNIIIRVPRYTAGRVMSEIRMRTVQNSKIRRSYSPIEILNIFFDGLSHSRRRGVLFVVLNDYVFTVKRIIGALEKRNCKNGGTVWEPPHHGFDVVSHVPYLFTTKQYVFQWLVPPG